MLLDLTNSRQLTDEAAEHIGTMKTLRILTLDGCTSLTDSGLDSISELYASLEVLSLAGLSGITDDGLMPIASSCKQLQILNINNCSNITHEILCNVARNCRSLSTLHASATQITDHGLERITHFFSAKNLTSLDLSFCSDISDHGIIAVAEKCPNITYFNGCGLHRITDVGARAICSHWWYLKYLNFEDLFLLDATAFWYDHIRDGRQAADDNMLKSLQYLNLSDCVNLSDRGMEGISQRCRHLEQLRMKGCDKLTELTLQLLSMKPVYDGTNANAYPTCDTLKLLDLSFCKGFSAEAIVNLLENCKVIEDLNISGISGVTDTIVEKICSICTALQKLSLQRCMFITDASLCSMSDYLWIEYLDISYCNRVTDEGVEVLTAVCSGILVFKARRVSKLTSKSMKSLTRNCKSIREVDVRECPLISQESVLELKSAQLFVKIEA